MRRAKLCDVYAMHLKSGIKIFQWAYDIPRFGQYIRVFEGIYPIMPTNLAEIVQSEHSYIISCDVKFAYRIGLVEFLGNIPVPEAYAFPQYRIDLWIYELSDKFGVWIRPTLVHPNYKDGKIKSYEQLDCLKDLPEEYQGVKLVDSYVSIPFLMYLFEYDFNLDNPRRFQMECVLGEKAEEVLSEYRMKVNQLWEQEKAMRKTTKRKS